MKIKQIVQQYIISTMRKEIQMLARDHENDVKLVSQVGAHLEDERLERLQQQGRNQVDFRYLDSRFKFQLMHLGMDNEGSISRSHASSSMYGVDYLATKSPPNMPSVRLTDEEEAKAAKRRKFYGGAGDALHLGRGCI